MNDVRNQINKFENINNSISTDMINESITTCTLDDLYRTVSDYIDKEFKNIRNEYHIKKYEDCIFISRKYLANYDDLNDDEHIIKRLIVQKDNITNEFSQFKDFCEKGIRGFTGLFKKHNKYINIVSSVSLHKVKNIQEDDKTIEHIFLYTEDKAEDLGTKENYIKTYGKPGIDDIDVTYVYIGLFLKYIQ